MPVDYSIPNWIHGANPLQALMTGSELGLRIAESNQRSALAWAELQRRNQEFQQQVAMEQQKLEAAKVAQQQHFAAQQQHFAAQQQHFAAQQQIAEENRLYNEQKLQVDTAYKKGQLDLKSQQLQMTAAAAAEKAKASGRFLQSLNTLTSGYIAEEGLTEEQARAKAVPQALYDSGMFQYVNPASLASMARSASGKSGEWKRSPSGYPYFETAQGGLHFEPRPVPAVNLVDQAVVSSIKSNIAALDRKFQEEVDPVKKGQIEDEIIRLEEMRSSILKKSQQPQQQPQQQPEQQPEQPVETSSVEAPKTFGSPQKGQVISGYEFQGGDPADEKNWRLASDQENDSEE